MELKYLDFLAIKQGAKIYVFMEHTKHLEIVLHKGVLLKHPFVE